MLTEDWTFDLYQERRNNKFANQPGLDLDHNHWSPTRHQWVKEGGKDVRKTTMIPPAQVTLPKGTKLKIARIYIRNGGGDMKAFDSVTFQCNPGTTAAKARKLGLLRGRFWAKLIDVNSMDVAFDGATMPIPEYREQIGA
jgi:hypothetical protein